MRIISGFKDYYDSAMAYGVDEKLKYIRIKKVFNSDNIPCEDVRTFDYKNNEDGLTIETKNILKPILTIMSSIPKYMDNKEKKQYLGFEFTPIIVGVCGKLYPALTKQHYIPKDTIPQTGEYETFTLYNPDQITTKLPESCIQSNFGDRKFIIDQLNEKLTNYAWNRSQLNYRSWNNLIASLGNNNFDNTFVALKTPIFILKYGPRGSYVYIENDELKKYNFQTIKNPIETFQEISMYLGNQLAVQVDPTVNVSDDILRDEKGFDNWSFRRHKDDPK